MRVEIREGEWKEEKESGKKRRTVERREGWMEKREGEYRKKRMRIEIREGEWK